jgi:hypothetical protein
VKFIFRGRHMHISYHEWMHLSIVCGRTPHCHCCPSLFSGPNICVRRTPSLFPPGHTIGYISQEDDGLRRGTMLRMARSKAAPLHLPIEYSTMLSPIRFSHRLHPSSLRQRLVNLEYIFSNLRRLLHLPCIRQAPRTICSNEP